MKRTSLAIILLSSILSTAAFADHIQAKVNQGDFSTIANTYGANTAVNINFIIRNAGCQEGEGGPIKMSSLSGPLSDLNNRVINYFKLDGLTFLKLGRCEGGKPLREDWVITLEIRGTYTNQDYFIASVNTNSVQNFDYTKNYNFVVNFDSSLAPVAESTKLVEQSSNVAKP